MRKLLTLAVMILTLIVANNLANAQSNAPQWVKNLATKHKSNQLFIVAQVGEKTTAWVSMYEKINGELQQIMTTPAFIGKNGLGKEREGDNKTPVGVFHFDKAFGIAENPGCKIPYTQVDENFYWSGERDFHYNELVDVRDYPGRTYVEGEHLTDYNPEYIYCLNMGYNADCTPGKGSALFLHCFGSIKPWTGGCVAIPVDKMRFVMQNVKPDCVLIIDSLKKLGGNVD